MQCFRQGGKNDEIRMTNGECPSQPTPSSFGFSHSFVILNSSFVIFSPRRPNAVVAPRLPCPDSPRMADLPDDSALRARMQKLRLREEDLEESFIRGSGAGGQKINKTSSTVVLRHIPSGIEVRCQRERSQSQNRLVARHELCDRLEAIYQKVKLDAQNEREKKRRQTRDRPRGLKRRYVAGKRHRSEIKQGRGKVGGEG